MSDKKRVVITGIGAVTPLGLDVKTTWDGVSKGRSGVRLIETFDTAEYASKIGATIDGFNIDHILSSKEQRKLDHFIQYALKATDEAVKDSNIEITDSNAARVGVALGSGIGGLPGIEKNHAKLQAGGPRKISPFFIPGSIINMAAGYVSILHKCKGPNISIVTACTTGAHNIGFAARMISYGDADVMICGGAEMAVCPMGLGGFSAMKALSTRNDEPEAASRPWDKGRDGFVLGEGAATLILEEYEHAKKRGAKIYGEVAGFAMSADAFHMTQPDPNVDGFERAMGQALSDAKVNREDIDYVNAHGTSTPLGDELEIAAIKNVFGDHAYKFAVSSTKSMTGHLLGAAGAIEAIIALLGMQNNLLPPTINLDDPSDSCDLNLVPHKAQERDLSYVMSNSFGFGGTNATLIFKKIDE